MRRINQIGCRYPSLGLAAAALLCGIGAPAFAEEMSAGATTKAGCCVDMMGKMPMQMQMPMPMPMQMPMQMPMKMPMKMPIPAAAPTAHAMPGSPGGAHLYHVGATGFFLDHAGTIALDATQTAALTAIRDTAMGEQAGVQRKIDQAEQDLWRLTDSGQPELAKVDGKVREIETLTGNQRIAFIRAVGQAAGILSPEQRAAVLADAAPGAQPMAPAEASPPPMKGMKPMGRGKAKQMQHDHPMPDKAMPMEDDKPMPMNSDKPMGDGHM